MPIGAPNTLALFGFVWSSILNNYLADHWCAKGHILLCLPGELTTELDDGRIYVLKPGMSYQVADQAEAHRSSTKHGATLFIVD
ncbi:MAG: DHCW motif cupin fold protein [Vibrio fluvialis]